ncbi:MAG: Stp1/IreP family PP2C-type Ser/Thr phosphatase [Candidatus Eisenbacteria bacterium]|uniref:Stp1/IreP family PP2C-type Ser/Thr phosphatase n=1 Tax=Eiseniibacteriota bacterium TaxID=2212470 RepID=A0A937XBY0_UNCEI|nr:Stp1/IreP family PP2C-type Ser/Thr phosphatase [Candidatus Eisenbacteria bacterium]
MRASARTDVGRLRDTNEDCVVLDLELGLFMVADGMGGRNGGEVASRLAVDLTVSRLRESLPALGACPEPIPMAGLLSEALTSAGRAIHARAASSADLGGMGTTAVLAVARGSNLHVAHVGDSRAYLLRAGRLMPLTRDHSLVAEMVEKGEITSNEARTHRLRSILTQTLGGESAPQVDVAVVPWNKEDCLLLCSDGLSGELEDHRIEAILERFRTDLKRASQELIRAANVSGGKDNVSVILACPE